MKFLCERCHDIFLLTVHLCGRGRLKLERVSSLSRSQWRREVWKNARIQTKCLQIPRICSDF